MFVFVDIDTGEKKLGYSRGLVSKVFKIPSVSFLKVEGPAAMVLSAYTANRPFAVSLLM